MTSPKGKASQLPFLWLTKDPLAVLLSLLGVSGLMGFLSFHQDVGLGSSWWLMPFVFYLGLSVLVADALLRLQKGRRPFHLQRPIRLLILAPHQDDCVIMAGGLAIKTAELQGEIRIVYGVQDDSEETALLRQQEAIQAWSLIGVGPESIDHLHLFSKEKGLHDEDQKEAKESLARVIDRFKPTMIVMPLFEGGHIEHDLMNHLVSKHLLPKAGVSVYEAPEYSPFLSLKYTPQKVITLCARWLFGLIQYRGSPDGIDGRPLYRLEMTPKELDLKIRMLACFKSQDPFTLSKRYGFEDTLVAWEDRPDGKLLAVTNRVNRALEGLPQGVLKRLLRWFYPLPLETVGRNRSMTLELERMLGYEPRQRGIKEEGGRHGSGG